MNKQKTKRVCDDGPRPISLRSWAKRTKARPQTGHINWFEPRGVPSYRALARVNRVRQRGVPSWADPVTGSPRGFFGPIFLCSFFLSVISKNVSDLELTKNLKD
jgi:hypothetical protein